MTKERERDIRTDTEYFTQNGVVYRKVTTYTILSNAKIRGEPDAPTTQEFRDAILNKSETKNKDGFISSRTN